RRSHRTGSRGSGRCRRWWTRPASTRAAVATPYADGWVSLPTRRSSSASGGWYAARGRTPWCAAGLRCSSGSPGRCCCSSATARTGGGWSGSSRPTGWRTRSSSPARSRGRRSRPTSTPGTSSRCRAATGSWDWRSRRSASSTSRPRPAGSGSSRAAREGRGRQPGQLPRTDPATTA
ncbi:MAG: Phosphatidylinositol alpha-mannosyltransferase, partial [uncultured Blastococcus sp.]